MSGSSVNYVWDTAVLRPDPTTGLMMAFRDDGSHDETVPGATQMYVRAERVPEGGIPKSLYIFEKFPEDDRATIPPIVTAGGRFVIVSPEVKAVMERFDLGASRFSPVDLLKSDRKTPFEGKH